MTLEIYCNVKFYNVLIEKKLLNLCTCVEYCINMFIKHFIKQISSNRPAYRHLFIDFLT